MTNKLLSYLILSLTRAVVSLTPPLSSFSTTLTVNHCLLGGLLLKYDRTALQERPHTAIMPERLSGRLMKHITFTLHLAPAGSWGCESRCACRQPTAGVHGWGATLVSTRLPQGGSRWGAASCSCHPTAAPAHHSWRKKQKCLKCIHSIPQSIWKKSRRVPLSCYICVIFYLRRMTV